MHTASNPAVARQSRSRWRPRLFNRRRKNRSSERFDHATSREDESAARAAISAEEAAALRSRVQAGLDLVTHHQEAIDWRIQVLHRQFDLLQEYSTQITADIAALETKWRELEAARAELLAADQHLDGEDHHSAVPNA